MSSFKISKKLKSGLKIGISTMLSKDSVSSTHTDGISFTKRAIYKNGKKAF